MSGPPIMYWTPAALMPPPEMNDTGVTLIRRLSATYAARRLAHEIHDLHLVRYVAVRNVGQPDVDRSLYGLRWSVSATLADRVSDAVSVRMSRAIRAICTCVDSSDLPSGAHAHLELGASPLPG